MKIQHMLFSLALICNLQVIAQNALKPGENPILRNAFTADPAPLVYKGRVYLYVGHDIAGEGEMFNMPDWLCYSSADMKTWTNHGSVGKPTDFKWAVKDAWAAQVVEKDGKFYLYATVQQGAPQNAKAIGVAVADNPLGPFKDARGSALISDSTTPSPNGWDDIDPTVLIDDDGTGWMAWGNPNLYLAKLKPNMTEIDGEIIRLNLPNYTEGPWLHKRGNIYYLTYAAFAHQGMNEKLCYATAPDVTGPWTYKGILTENARNSYTIHPGIVEFKKQSYLFYHNATLSLNGQDGALGRRSVCVEYLYYTPDGSMIPVKQTVAGISVPPLKKAAQNNLAAAVARAKTTPVVSNTPVKIQHQEGAKPLAWPGMPAVNTAGNPYQQCLLATSFNGQRGTATLGQTFRLEADLKLQRISVYAGDGFPTEEGKPLKLALYDLGEGRDTNLPAYSASANLFEEGKGFELHYSPKAPGLLNIEIPEQQQVTLKPGHTYVLEIQGQQNVPSLYWRRTRGSTYSDGAAYADGKLIDVKDGSDFGMAVYGKAITR